MRDDINPMFYRVLVAAALLLIGSSVLLRFAYHSPARPMGWVDAFYFTASTVATVGFGDFSFLDQQTWLRVWAIGLIFAGLITTAILVAFIADLLLSRRFAQSAGRRQVRHLRDHIIVVGLGSFGVRVVSDLKAAGHDVAVIERSEDNRYLSVAAELDVPVIFGDARLRQTLEVARPTKPVRSRCSPSATWSTSRPGSCCARCLDPAYYQNSIGRTFRSCYGCTTARWAQRWHSGSDSNNVRSTVELAAPWFIGAAMGLQVFGTFSVGQRSFMVGGVDVQLGSELDGMRMADLSTQTRVIAITRPGTPVRLHPRRDTGSRRGHRLSRRPVPGTAGHPAQRDRAPSSPTCSGSSATTG